MPYIYNDEDNLPMIDDPFDQPPRYHNVTTYATPLEMKMVERGELPFDERKPDDGCWNCESYVGHYCTKNWGGSPDYHDHTRDRRTANEYCENWEEEARE